MPSDPPVILFDGVCNLCSAAVRFVIARDPGARFRFAALQSEAGRALLRALGQPVPEGEPDTIVLVERGSVYTRSDAALRIARGLRGPVRALVLLHFVPRRIRDALYRFVARNRFRWFGRRDQCWVPTPSLQSRFLDGPAGRP